MNKIQTVSAQQRLKQLSKRQLGGDAATRISSSTANSSNHSTAEHADAIQSGAMTAIHARLKARAGLSATDPQFDYQTTLADRAERRLQIKLEQQQHNLERVIQLALDYCADQQSSQDIDPDWFSYFTELVQNISTLSMQKLWAKILASELKSPGSFSYKTLNLLKQMSYKDALTLQLAASLSCRNKFSEAAHIYFGYVQQGSFWRWLRGKNRGLLNLSQFGLTYPQILNLVELGLLHQTEIESGQLSKDQQIAWSYHQSQLVGKVKHPGIVLQYYKFTPIGVELMPMLVSQPNPAYWQALQSLLSEVFTWIDA